MAQESTPMSYAEALTEAKQMLVQQQLRIKADAEKLKSQQQTISEQTETLTSSERRITELTEELQRLGQELSERESRINEQAAEVRRLSDELSAVTLRLQDTTTAKEQAEAVIDRQGERLTSLQATAADIERRLAEQTQQIETITGERDALKTQLPTQDDEAALSSMVELLAKRPKRTTPTHAPQLRMADDQESHSTEQTPESETPPHAEAA